MGDERMRARGVLLAARHIRRLFLHADYGPMRTSVDFSRAAIGVAWLVRFFYLALAYWLATRFGYDHAYDGPPTDPLWPIGLVVNTVGAEWLAYEMPLAVFGSALGLLAVFFPGKFLFRLGVFLYLLFAVAMANSYGSINNDGHIALYVSFALLFLPSAIGSPGRMRRKDAMTAIMVFWFAQSLVLLPYALSGLFKIYVSRLELLAPDGFVRIMTERALEDTTEIPWLLPFFASQPLLAQFLLLGAVYVQAFALLALFRPHLHRPLGAALIAFHFGTDYLLNIFFHNIVLLGIFLVFSPFAQGRFSLTGLVKSLPVFGVPFQVAGAYRRTRRGADKAWLVYDGECYFCRNYARLLDARESVGELILVNARDGGPLVEEVRALRYNLDDGMALKMGGRWRFGSDALNTLALLSARRGVFGVANRLLFSSPSAAWLAYPFLNCGRRALLGLRRVPPLER